MNRRNFISNLGIAAALYPVVSKLPKNKITYKPVEGQVEAYSIYYNKEFAGRIWIMTKSPAVYSCYLKCQYAYPAGKYPPNSIELIDPGRSLNECKKWIESKLNLVS